MSFMRRLSTCNFKLLTTAIFTLLQLHDVLTDREALQKARRLKLFLAYLNSGKETRASNAPKYILNFSKCLINNIKHMLYRYVVG